MVSIQLGCPTPSRVVPATGLNKPSALPSRPGSLPVNSDPGWALGGLDWPDLTWFGCSHRSFWGLLASPTVSRRAPTASTASRPSRVSSNISAPTGLPRAASAGGCRVGVFVFVCLCSSLRACCDFLDGLRCRLVCFTRVIFVFAILRVFCFLPQLVVSLTFPKHRARVWNPLMIFLFMFFVKDGLCLGAALT